MSHPKEFPPSPEYLARQAERQRWLEKTRQRLTWTDAQYLAERDAGYVAQQRQYTLGTIKDIESQIEEDNDIEGYVRHYGTDEG